MKIGIKSGSFVIIHAGHIWMLEQAKKQCDKLIVLTNSDTYIKRKKGVVPIPLADRIKILSSIKYVDEVSWFNDDTEDWWISERCSIKTKEEKIIVFHSEETKIKAEQDKDYKIPGQEYADEIIYIPRINGSTTDIFKIIRGES